MEVIHHEPVLKIAPRLRPNCEPSLTATTLRATSSSSQRHVQIVLFDHSHDHVADHVTAVTDSVAVTHPAVGMSENLGILPGGYFAQLLAKRSQ